MYLPPHLISGHFNVLFAKYFFVVQETTPLQPSTLEVVVSSAVTAAAAHSGPWVSTSVTSLGGGREEREEERGEGKGGEGRGEERRGKGRNKQCLLVHM